MIPHRILAIATALVFAGCASRYTTLPADPGSTPDPDLLLKTMCTRLASARQFRISATNTIAADVADRIHKPAKSEIEILVSRPKQLSIGIAHRGTPDRDMLFDGTSFTVADRANNFYSKAPLPGTIDTAIAEISEIYGFEPPLAEFLHSDPNRSIKKRITSTSYIGKGSVRENGASTPCHRIGLTGSHAEAELWIGVDDSLPRRLKATRAGSDGSDLLMEIDFLSWNMNPRINDSTFRFQPASGAEEIPMVTVEEAAKSN